MQDVYKSLLPAGITDIQEDQIEDLLVRPFTSPAKRQLIIERFKVLLSEIRSFGIDFEIWIDGSFVTDKEEPSDIDLVFFAKTDAVNALQPDHQEKLAYIFEKRIETKIRYKCDVYFVRVEDGNLRSYWRGWFGFDREEKPKGIARIYI